MSVIINGTEAFLKQTVPVSESLLEYQQVKDRSITTTDVHLICPDGIVPVHAFVLQSVSPFFGMMFQAQGDYYFGNRPVIIPHWSVDEITRMVQFIYTGLTLVTKKELQEMNEMFTFFKISIPQNDIKTENRKAGPRTSMQPQQVLAFRGSEAHEVRLYPHGMPAQATAGKSEEMASAKRKAEDLDIPPGAKKISVSKRGEGTLDKDVIVVIPRSKDTPGPSSKHPSKSRIPAHDPDRISSTDTSDGEIDWIECKNSEWFMKEACRCQRCNKSYSNPSDASSCLTNNHNRLRCYLCFKVVRTTAKLFLHFSKRHKQGAREQTLLCGWCDQTVPFKSVSCHVISLHLTGMIAVGSNPARNNRLQGRRRGPIGIFPIKAAATEPSEAKQTVQAVGKGKSQTATNTEDFIITKKDEKEGAAQGGGSGLSNGLKQTLRYKSICGKTRVFVINIQR